jgi:hypothetical protein
MMVASPDKDPAERDPAGKESAEVCFGSPSDLERDKRPVCKD